MARRQREIADNQREQTDQKSQRDVHRSLELLSALPDIHPILEMHREPDWSRRRFAIQADHDF